MAASQVNTDISSSNNSIDENCEDGSDNLESFEESSAKESDIENLVNTEKDCCILKSNELKSSLNKNVKSTFKNETVAEINNVNGTKIEISSASFSSESSINRFEENGLNSEARKFGKLFFLL